MSNFETFIGKLNSTYPDPNERGKQFEYVCKWFLENDPLYKSQFQQVWLWDEWPGRFGPDKGVDLVAEPKECLPKWFLT